MKSIEHRIQFHYLDGLRGLTALYVVLVHVNRYMGEQLPVLWLLLGKTLRYGHFAVAVFIVLSGYVLMLPIARSQSGYLSGSLLDYIKRRARRILPPYYAALFVSLLLALIILKLNQLSLFPWHESPDYGEFHPIFSLSDVFSHLLLIHNLSRQTLGSINSPMWSVATEWQIYFLFPLLLLPIWRRFGLFSVVLTAFLIGVAPLYFLHDSVSGSPWFLGLFALGMAAADLGFSQKTKLIDMRKSLPWDVLAIIFIIIAFITEWKKLGLDVWISESFCGLATACLIISCTKLVIEGKKKPLVLQILESRWAIALGAFSYSLYLTHGLVVTVVGNFLLNLHMPPIKFAQTFYLIAVPMSLLIAYLFYLVFERPFMSNFLKKRKVKNSSAFSRIFRKIGSK